MLEYTFSRVLELQTCLLFLQCKPLYSLSLSSNTINTVTPSKMVSAGPKEGLQVSNIHATDISAKV